MNKAKKIIYWISTLWLCLGMVSTGIVQLTQGQDGPGAAGQMMQLGYPLYLMTFLGILKMLGVIALLIPKFPMAKEWAYAGFIFLMTGAMYSHLAAHDPVVEVLPALLLFALTWLSWFTRTVRKGKT